MRIITPVYIKIYEDLRLRFFCGTYRKGERFPSCASLCGEYGVSDRTMRRAVRLLVENGFIANERRKAPIVIYECAPQPSEPPLTLSARELAELLDILDAMALVHPAVLLKCMPLCDGEDRAWLASVLKAMGENLDAPRAFASLTKCFWDSILGKSGNQMALYFFSQMRPLAGPFHAVTDRAGREAYLASMEDILARMEAGSGLEQIDFQFYSARFRAMLCSMCAEEEKLPAAKGLQDASPEETLYRSVYLDLLRRVQEGEFQKGDFLPSRAELCKQYGVSGITAAHAVQKLREMGVAEAVPGRGIRLLANVEQLGGKFDRELLIRQAQKFADGIGMLAVTCEKVARHAVETAGSRDGAALYRAMAEALADTGGNICLPGMLLRFITERLRLQTLRNLYKKIEEEFYMGYQFSGLLPDLSEEEARGLAEMCVAAAKALAAGEREEFARSAARLYRQIYRQFVAACDYRGIRGEVFTGGKGRPLWEYTV